MQPCIPGIFIKPTMGLRLSCSSLTPYQKQEAIFHNFVSYLHHFCPSPFSRPPRSSTGMMWAGRSLRMRIRSRVLNLWSTTRGDKNHWFPSKTHGRDFSLCSAHFSSFSSPKNTGTTALLELKWVF